MKKILTAISILLLSVGPPSAQAAERSDAEKQAIEKIEESGGTVREIAQNDDRLEVNFQLTGESVTDGHLAPVAELSNVYELRLGKTSVTDAGLAHIKGLSALNRLHLENTKVGDAGLAHLKGLKELTYLNLFGTSVSDSGLKHLTGLKKLKNLYVWQTNVTDAGVGRLQKALPDLKIEMGWDLAEVEATQKKQEEAKAKEEKKEGAN